jgi:hypothetical protein
MVLRGVPLSNEQQQGYGFLERMFVDMFSRRFTALQNIGLSANEIAARMNSGNHWGTTWDGRRVIGLVAQKDKIARADAVRRRERELTA